MTSTVTLGGNSIQVEGSFPQAGQQAPAFTLHDPLFQVSAVQAPTHIVGGHGGDAL